MDHTHNPTEEINGAPAHARSALDCAVLMDAATPELYRQNAFRRTGLSVLAGPRDISKRLDQLRMAIELGAPVTAWSFAPHPALSADQLRESAQVLKDPTTRLVAELFWFWPEKYPESSADAALDRIAHGETEAAFELWRASVAEGSDIAMHNLAVYYHLLALDFESDETTSEAQLAELWHAALDYWDRVLDDEVFWIRLRARVGLLGDARVVEEFVDRLRAALPDALSKINSALAVVNAASGEPGRADLHAALAVRSHRDPHSARRSLEDRAAPVARRVDACVTETRIRQAGRPETGIVDALSLLQDTAEDLRLVATLCGRDSEYFQEISNGVVDVALGCVVGYQRETGDDRRCLPLLLHLQGFEATPEVKKRVERIFNVIHENAATAQLAVEPSAEISPAESDRSQSIEAYRLIADVLIPGGETVALAEPERGEYVMRVAGMLKPLAFEAANKHDDLNFAIQIFDTVLQLPASAERVDHWQQEKIQLLENFQLRKELELHLEANGHVIAIDAGGLRCDDRRIGFEEILGLRHDYSANTGGEGSPAAPVIAWLVGDEEIELNSENFFVVPDEVQSQYDRIIASFYYFAAPTLVDRLVRLVKAGDDVFLGPTPLKKKGMAFVAKNLFRKTEELVPYSRIKHEAENGRLVLSSMDNPRLSEIYPVLGTWNAVIIGAVIDALAAG